MSLKAFPVCLANRRIYLFLIPLLFQIQHLPFGAWCRFLRWWHYSSLVGNKDVFLVAIISAVHITSHLCPPCCRGVAVRSHGDNNTVSLRNVTLAGEPAERHPRARLSLASSPISCRGDKTNTKPPPQHSLRCTCSDFPLFSTLIKTVEILLFWVFFF